jgi:hypothetical protein
MEMTPDDNISVLMLLKKFKGWVESEDHTKRVQFLKEEHQIKEVAGLVAKLISRFENAKADLAHAKQPEKEGSTNAREARVRKQKRVPVLSDFLDWHETHKEGRELWRKLASYALIDIDPASKGNAKLFKFLEAATRFEDLLYGLEEFYRDHTLHSLWVYLIGEYLLREKLPRVRDELNWHVFNDIDRDQQKYGYCRDLVEKSINKEEEFRDKTKQRRDAVWCIIALCHDLGYSLEKLDKLNEKVLAVLKFFDVSDFKHVGYFLDIEHQFLVSQFLELMAIDVRIVPSDDYRELEDLKRERKTSKYNKRLEENVLVKCYRDDSTYWRLCRAMERKEHGILSAYLIFKLLGIFADTSIRGPAEEWGLDDDEVHENIIRGDILFAIAQHQFEFAHLVQLASLGDILVLADELEEFSRLGRQLISRKYSDTAAEVVVQFEAVGGREIAPGKRDGNKWTPGSRINVQIWYTSQHIEKKEFLHFFWRKARRLCQLYSLDQMYSHEDELEPGQEKYCRIDSIRMTVEWSDPDSRLVDSEQDSPQRKETESYWFILSKKPAETRGFLPPYAYKYEKDGETNRKEHEAKEYPMKCHEDELLVCAGDQDVLPKSEVENPEL